MEKKKAKFIQSLKIFPYLRCLFLGLSCLVIFGFPVNSSAQNSNRPAWYSELEIYLSEKENHNFSYNQFLNFYGEKRDERLNFITNLVLTDRKDGIADLILYYENLSSALYLYSQENIGAALAYKTKAISHLNEAVKYGLVEAKIEYALLSLDGVFVPHAYENAVNSLLKHASHPRVYSLLFDYFFPGPILAYLPSDLAEKYFDNRPSGRGWWTNEILEYYSTDGSNRRSQLERKFGMSILKNRVFPIKPKPAWLDEYFDNVFAKCLNFYLHEAETGESDAYRKMTQCTGGYPDYYSSFLPGLKRGVRDGQVHYLATLGKVFLFDDDVSNDAEGLEYLKLSVSYGYYGKFDLAQHYNFETGEIKKCQKIFDTMPPEWRRFDSLHIEVDQSGGDYFEVVLTLPAGCFRKSARINDKIYKIRKDKKIFKYSIRIRFNTAEFKKECFEFVNGRVSFHPEFIRGGSVTGSKQIANCGD